MTTCPHISGDGVCTICQELAALKSEISGFIEDIENAVEFEDAQKIIKSAALFIRRVKKLT